MKKERIFSLILIIVFAGLLFAANRDIGHYEYNDVLRRSFSPEENEKWFYYLGDPVTLKPGTYDLTLSGELPQYRCGISILDESDNMIFEDEIQKPGHDVTFTFQIREKSRRIRISFSYDPIAGYVQINHIRISGDHVFYKDTIVRHLVISLLLVLILILLLLRVNKPEVFCRFLPFFREPKNERAFIFLMLLTLLVSYLLLDPDNFINGTDTMFHLCRIKGIAADMKAGIFPPRIELFWMDDVGYGVGFYYPEIFLTGPAACLLLGFDLLTVYKYFNLFYVFCTLLVFFLAAKKLSGGRYAAGYAAAIYIGFSVYRIHNQFCRDGLGESLAYIFMPLIITGLYRIFRREKAGWQIFAIGFTGVLLTHMISFSIAVILTAVFLLIRIRTLLRDRMIIADLLKSVCLALCLSAFFLLPMVEQINKTPALKINQILSGAIDLSYASEAIPFRSLFLREWVILPDGGRILDMYPGWPMLLVPVLRLLLIKRKEDLRTADTLMAAGIIVCLCGTDLFPWQLFSRFLNTIEKSWRLFQSGTVFLSLAGGLYIGALCTKANRIYCLCGLFLFCAIFTPPIYKETYTRHHIVFKHDFYLPNNQITGAEYMPPDLSRRYIEPNIDRIQTADSSVQISNFKRQPLSISFDFLAPVSAEIDFTVPFIYYYGYRAELIPPDGSVSMLTASAAGDGFVRVQGPETESGTIHVFYRRTPVQTAGDIISLLTMLLCLYIELRRKAPQSRQSSKKSTRFSAC